MAVLNSDGESLRSASGDEVDESLLGTTLSCNDALDTGRNLPVTCSPDLAGTKGSRGRTPVCLSGANGVEPGLGCNGPLPRSGRKASEVRCLGSVVVGISNHNQRDVGESVVRQDNNTARFGLAYDSCVWPGNSQEGKDLCHSDLGA